MDSFAVAAASAFRAINRANPTSYGRHTVAGIARRLGALPQLGPHNVGSDIVINVASHDFIDLSLYFAAYEYEIRRQFLRRVLDGYYVLDVGANIGCYTALASKLVGPSGVVLAVEANPIMVERLTETIHLNDLRNVRILPLAASNEDAIATLHLPADHSHGEASLRKQNWVSLRTIEVPTRQLDNELDVPRLDFVKMDIEGAELLALQGAEGLLRQHRPILLIEIVPQFLRQFGSTSIELLDFVMGVADYDVYKVGRHVTSQCDPGTLRSDELALWGNFLFLPRGDQRMNPR